MLAALLGTFLCGVVFQLLFAETRQGGALAESLQLKQWQRRTLELRSNLPDDVRFSSNGLVLDGGLVVLSYPRHGQALCLVIGLPLGISRTGFYQGDPSGSLSSALCLPTDA